MGSVNLTYDFIASLRPGRLRPGRDQTSAAAPVLTRAGGRSTDDPDVEIRRLHGPGDGQPEEQIRLHAPGRADVAEVDDGLPAELPQERRDMALRVGVVAAEERVALPAEAFRMAHQVGVDRIERLNDAGVREGALNALPERIARAGEERRRRSLREVERV